MGSLEMASTSPVREEILAWLRGFPDCPLEVLCSGVNHSGWLVLLLLEEMEEEGLVSRIQIMGAIRWRIRG